MIPHSFTGDPASAIGFTSWPNALVTWPGGKVARPRLPFRPAFFSYPGAPAASAGKIGKASPRTKARGTA